MPSDGLQTPLPANLFARLTTAARYAISGVTPDSWFGPQQPLAPQAPPEVKGRQWDYPFGVNLSYVPPAILILTIFPILQERPLCFGSSSDSTIRWAFSMI
jgi:hypothetical protein